jgi:hypothetical protein
MSHYNSRLDWKMQEVNQDKREKLAGRGFRLKNNTGFLRLFMI